MGIIMLFRLLSVPVFLKFWGVELYGEWIVLSALTAYFQMTDIGLNTATANEFSFYYVNSDFKKCNILFNNNLFFTVFSFSLVFIALSLLNSISFFPNLFKFNILKDDLIETAIFILFAQVLIGTLNNLLNTIYRATNHFAKGVMIDNIIRIGEHTTLLAGVALKLSIPLILLLVLIVKIIGVLLKYNDSRSYYKLKISLNFFDLAQIKRTFVPAISFFILPISNSIAFQGFTLLINSMLGSIAVVQFNTLRTLISFVRSGIDILYNSMWPEITLAYGRKDFLLMRTLNRYTIFFSLAIVTIFSLILAVFGKSIFIIWTGNEIEFNSVLFYLFLVTVFSNTLWSSSCVILQSTNNHKLSSLLYLIATMVSLGIAYVIISFTKNISFVPCALLIIDVIMIPIVFKQSFAIIKESFSGLISSLKEISYSDLIKMKKENL